MKKCCWKQQLRWQNILTFGLIWSGPCELSKVVCMISGIFVKSRNDYQWIPTNRITRKRGDTWGSFHPNMFLMPIRWTVSTSFVKNRTSINLFVDMLQGLISFVRKERIQPLHKIKKWKVYIEQKFSKQRLTRLPCHRRPTTH